MALDQSALLDLLAQLKATDVTDRIRSMTEALNQELMDAEAASVYRCRQVRTHRRPHDRAQRHSCADVDHDCW